MQGVNFKLYIHVNKAIIPGGFQHGAKKDSMKS
jgi:hypothetical protein